ncbi:hypothetical protein BaOVIS_017720 [Babesia ovis]|uniref:Uncharacterized protein n=1 Tax=Babesia ovis TaxID=5869 RepID=A0A9W5TAP5_BABOV|nr:hypothetical protein BaOVIS_017720 [Babesia ovis]
MDSGGLVPNLAGSVGNGQRSSKRKSRFDSPSPLSNATSTTLASSDTSADKPSQFMHPHRGYIPGPTVSGFVMPPPPPPPSATSSVTDLRTSSGHFVRLPPDHLNSSGLRSNGSHVPPPPPVKSRFDKPKPVVAPIDLLPSPLDLCNVGTMASILLKFKADGTLSGPYSSLPKDTEVPESDEPSFVSELIQLKASDFYDELEELLDSLDSSIPPGDLSFDYSRRKVLNTTKHRALPLNVVTEQDFMRQHASLTHGGSLVSTSGAVPALRPTTSGFSPPLKESPTGDVFDSFRKKRASDYHEHLAIKYATLHTIHSVT